MRERQIRWIATQETGLEHLVMRSSQHGIQAEGVAIGGDDDEQTLWAVTYEVHCAPDWTARRVSVIEHAGQRRLVLVGDGRGGWTDGEGRPLEHLAGCLDVDIRATPFTNTLPISRLALAVGASATLRVLYIPTPSLVPQAVAQRYTALAPRRWRFEGLDTGFVVDLTTDEDGLVVEYPGLWRRLP